MENFKLNPRVVWLAALGSAVIGICLEIAAHQLLSTRHAVWLIKPYLYVGLPKPFVRTDLISVFTSAVLVVVAVFLTLLVRRTSSRPAPFSRLGLGLGLILGSAIGEAVTGIALADSDILVVARGAWRYAFSPFNVALFIGLLLTLPELLHAIRAAREPKDSFRWRDLIQKRAQRDD